MKEKFKLTALERNWILYDIGNSAFTLLVSTLIPIYFNSLAGSAGVNEDMYLSYWGYAGSISTVLVAIIAPICGTLSDRGGIKKPLFLVCLLLGAVGLPVFSGFQGGFGVLLGVTGGYLWGSAATGLIYWGFEKLWKPIGVILGLLACYTLGSFWFCLYSGGASFGAAVASCVIPYVIPDVGKLYLAWVCGRRIQNELARNG